MAFSEKTMVSGTELHALFAASLSMKAGMILNQFLVLARENFLQMVV